MERLRSSKTIGEILETAMSFEKTARDFYAGLEGKVSKPIRELVRELAEEEARHYALFDELSKRDDVHARVADLIAAPANDHKFSDYVHLPDLGEQPDDQSILQYAMGREHAAMEQYAALAEELPEGPIRDLFRYLSQEELAHKAELEKKYYALVYPTNV
jgi:rubrerythrin